MTRTIILSTLAILSLALSFFYEVKPAPTAVPEKAVPAVGFTPEAKSVNKDIIWALALPAPIEEPTPETYHVPQLGLYFKKPANITLAKAVARWLGTPYRPGSSSKRGTDCSGFVTSIYREVYGIHLSRSSQAMFQHVARVQKDSLRTGDLVFFRRSPRQPIFHVGIYLKDNKFIHSATSRGVMVSSLQEPYYRNYFYAAGRVH